MFTKDFLANLLPLLRHPLGDLRVRAAALADGPIDFLAVGLEFGRCDHTTIIGHVRRKSMPEQPLLACSLVVGKPALTNAGGCFPG